MNTNGSNARALDVLGALGFAWLVFLVLYLAGRPIGTDDFWWHLKLGEIYLQLGPWLDADPLLHTATVPPDPAAWAFDIALHLLKRWVGFQGLRVAHVLLVATIIWQAYWLLRKASGGTLAAVTASAVWLSLAWYRLVQFRPHLVSILATLVLVRLLFTPGGTPSWRRVALAMAVLVLWANSHALYLLGLLLCGGAIVAVSLRALLARYAARQGATSPPGWSEPRPLIARFGWVTGLGLLVTTLNPRGTALHATFLKSSREDAISRIADDWAPFDPLRWSDSNPALNVVSWSLTDGLFLVVAIAVGVGIVRCVRSPSAETLRVVDPLLLGFAAASLFAIATAVRFQWLAFFPLLLLANIVGNRDPSRARPGARTLALGLCLALAIAVPSQSGYQERAIRVPRNPERYLATAIDGFKYYTQSVRFLRDARLEGNLYNSYFMGGYLSYWVGPALEIFVGGTLNYPERVAIDHRAIGNQQGPMKGVGPLELLDRNDVDVFLGVGVPIGTATRRGRLYTTTNLERATGWTLVFRTLRSAIYLRSNARNEPNFDRVAEFYRRQGIPFDRAVGFDAAHILREHPRWARQRGLVTRSWKRSVAEAEDSDLSVRAHALDRLGDTYAALGAYALQIENERRLLEIAPSDPRAHQRLIYALLRLDLIELASARLARLVELAPDDRRTRAFARGHARYVEARSTAPGHPAFGVQRPASAVLSQLPVFNQREAARVVGR